MKKFLTIPQSLVKKFFSLFCFEIITCLFFEDSFSMRLKSSKLTFSYDQNILAMQGSKTGIKGAKSTKISCKSS